MKYAVRVFLIHIVSNNGDEPVYINTLNIILMQLFQLSLHPFEVSSFSLFLNGLIFLNKHSLKKIVGNSLLESQIR